jgi:hypothetical protein
VPNAEIFAAELSDDGVVTEVLRPSAILTEESARSVLVELAIRDVRGGGLWQSDPTRWTRVDVPWHNEVDAGEAVIVGAIQVSYGTPTRYDITIYRVTITAAGRELGWTVEALCDEALGFAGLSLATCPRASLAAPPKPFRF